MDGFFRVGVCQAVEMLRLGHIDPHFFPDFTAYAGLVGFPSPYLASGKFPLSGQVGTDRTLGEKK